ncbi:MAG: Chemotaxis protein methyltransferase [Candidatus Heimdallarchaeota archaeon LC_2]|nr:MAG: Chemotaxis protein methyltransferase [Candidatus Heimdallarchaeota archaeon LC_2]
MIKKSKKNKVATGATLSSLHGPKGTGNALSRPRDKKTGKKTSYNVQPIVLKGRDLENLDSVLNFLNQLGISVSAYKRGYLIRRTRARIGRLRLSSYKEYLAYLKVTPDEIKELEEALSINVTRFFRNEDTYDFIRDSILPTLFGRNNSNKTSEVKIWSAGCAVGAEPYSLAILCRDKKYLNRKVNILATDINIELISIAQNGVYSPHYLAEMTSRVATKYFSLDRDQNYKVKASIKRIVKFQRLDLTKDPYPKNYDIVVCRNVLIYIDSKMQQQIIENFYKTLKVGGILVLGRTETLRGKWKKKFIPVSPKHRVYRKV